jgi:hypothetical protein
LSTGDAPAGATCKNKEKLEEGKARQTANKAKADAVAEAKLKKAPAENLEEKAARAQLAIGRKEEGERRWKNK